MTALKHVWLGQNGFEHVLCGELNPNGTVGGLHLWSEFQSPACLLAIGYHAIATGVAPRPEWQPAFAGAS